MKKGTLLIIFLLISLSISAQLKFFVEFSGNYSIVPSSKKVFLSEVNSEETSTKLLKEETYKANYQNHFGGDIMVGLNYFFHPTMCVETGFNLNLTHFNQTLDKKIAYHCAENPSQFVPAPPSGSHTGEANDFGLFYLNVPVSAFYHLFDNRLAIGGGVIPSFYVGGKRKYENIDGNQFQKFGVGLQAQFRYRATKKIWITSAFQYFNTKIYKSSAKQSYSHNQLVKLGLRYDF